MKSSSHTFGDEALLNAAAILAGVAAALLVKYSFSREEAEPETQDTTEYLLRDPRNAARLLSAVERFRRGEQVAHPLAQRPSAVV